MDDIAKDQTQKRLKRIEGQIRGIHRMVDEDRYCGDVLNQIAAVQRSLQSTAKHVLRNHLETCVVETVLDGDTRQIQRSLDEVATLLYDRLR